MVAAAAVLWWPNGLSDDPPWGLDEVDMPVTEADMLAVIDRMPDIDGTQPIFNDDGMAGIVSYGGFYRSIFILPADEPPGAEDFVDFIRQMITEAEAAGNTVDKGISTQIVTWCGRPSPKSKPMMESRPTA